MVTDDDSQVPVREMTIPKNQGQDRSDNTGEPNDAIELNELNSGKTD